MNRWFTTVEGLATLIKWLSIAAAVIPAMLGLAILWASVHKDALQKVIDDEKSKKIQKLEKQQRPRTLSDLQMLDAIERLKPFKGQRVHFLIKDLPEPLHFASQLRSVFEGAGLVVEGGRAWISNPEVIVVIRSADVHGPTGNAGGEILQTLKDADIPFVHQDLPEEALQKLGTNIEPGTIHIYIGPKFTSNES